MSTRLFFRLEGPLNPTRSVPFDGDLLIGGGPECALVLPHATVAARHARITGSADRLLLAGLGPATTVRRAGHVFVVRSGIPFPLVVGDVIGLGEVRFQLLPEPAEADRGNTRMFAGQREPVPEAPPTPAGPPQAAPEGRRRPGGATRIVDPRTLAPDAPAERTPILAVPTPRRAPDAPPERMSRPTEPAPRSSRALELRSEAPRPAERAPGPAPVRPTHRPVDPRLSQAVRPAEPPSVAPRPVELRPAAALRPASAARAPDRRPPPDPLEDGPTGFFSRQAIQAPSVAPALAPPAIDPHAEECLVLQAEIDGLEAAVERLGGAAQEQRRRAEHKAALEAELGPLRRSLQDTERLLATANGELAAHQREATELERRCRTLETGLAELKRRKTIVETLRDEALRRLREAEQARDATWQDVWSLEYEQLRLDGLIENLEIALGLKR